MVTFKGGELHCYSLIILQ